jgi:acyl-CoA-binding protein
MTVNSLSDDHWAKTEDVTDVFSITAQGSTPEYDDEISRATDTIQAKWFEATGNDTLPDPSEIPDLLVQATAYQAVYEYRSGNLPDDDNPEREGRYERLSRQKFEAWEGQKDVSDQNKDTSKTETVSGRSTSLDPLGSGGVPD